MPGVPLVADNSTLSITSNGNAPTYPVFTITLSSAGTAGVLSLECHGKTILLACSASYLTMVVDMARQQIRDGSGADITHLMSSEFWPLLPGSNTITLDLSGATPPSVTALTAAWRDRWY